MEDPGVVLDQLLALAPDALFALYAEMLPGEADGAANVARALKEQARRGLLDENAGGRIALLTFCLVDAPSPASAFHLAKALAAFGRQARSAAPYVAAHLANVHVVDDESFWIFDGLLYALGFLGGPAAAEAIAAVRAEDPPRAARKSGVYEGELQLGFRAAHHAETLQNVAQLLSVDDAGRWRERRSTLEPARADRQKTNWRLRR